MARISRTGTTDSTGVASTTVTGSGGGRLKFISRNGGLWSNSYEVDDLIFYDNATESSHNDNWFIRLPNLTTMTREADGTVIEWTGTYGHVECENGRFYNVPTVIEFDVLEQSNARIQYYSGSATNIEKSASLTRTGHYRCINTLNSQKIYCDDDLLYEFSISFNQYYFAFLSNVSGDVERMIKFSNFKVYPVFSTPQHYTPIALSSSASIIQTGETATLTAELTNVLGEKLAQKSVNFIEKVEHLYENTSEVSQVYNSGQNVTVLSPVISRTDLGTSWTLSFDLKTDCESRVFIGNSASAVATNPQYSIFMGRDVSNVIAYGFRTTTTTVSSSSVASTSYHSCKIVFNNGTITYYVDDTQVGTKTVSFYGNYDNYVVGLVAWGTGTLYAKNIVLDNGSGGDILIGTGTTNSQGIATTTLTGTGKGERQFIASNSSILSETYTIMDTP